MTTDSGCSRRRLLGSAAAFGLSMALAPMVRAEPNTGAPMAEGEPFSFDLLTEAMKKRAEQSDPGPYRPQLLLDGLDYDGYRNIAFRPEAARWNEKTDEFRLQAFHRGWLFPDAVAMFDVSSGTAKPFSFTSDDFEYREQLEGRLEPGTPMPGVAGWRMLSRLNTADRFDELVAFLGASYFRALGQGSVYGASARGLAIDTATGRAEEFPRFSAFYLERPAPGVETVIINAALDSRRVTGAYRFVITPGAVTQMEVTARLFFRETVEELGIAPLTSMFLFDRTTPGRFHDYRPQVHDSNGLGIRGQDGRRIWRTLANPPRLGQSWISASSMQSFGLYQRDRQFDEYSDAEARYEKRPSIEVQPLNDWGTGYIRLIEIPTEQEATDNIVAYWRPADPAQAGSSKEYRYRMLWGDLAGQNDEKLAYVVSTASGEAGVSGSKNEEGGRKFVVDFKGGRLDGVTETDSVQPKVAVNGGQADTPALRRIEGTGLWRLVFDVRPSGADPLELRAWLEGFDSVLSETWTYQWVPK